MTGIADIVRRLLTDEHERLVRDHYDDLVTSSCDGCRQAAMIRAKLDEGIAFLSPARAAMTPGVALDQSERRRGGDRRQLVIY